MAWWVVLGHALILSGLSAFIPQRIGRIVMAGDIAVDVFIIVSGFVITNLMLAKKETYLPYIVRRAFRIYPIYVLCLRHRYLDDKPVCRGLYRQTPGPRMRICGSGVSPRNPNTSGSTLACTSPCCTAWCPRTSCRSPAPLSRPGLEPVAGVAILSRRAGSDRAAVRPPHRHAGHRLWRRSSVHASPLPAASWGCGSISRSCRSPSSISFSAFSRA